MDFVFWIILIVLIVGVVWWLLNRSSSSSTGDSTPIRTDGGLSGGSAAASAEAAGTTGIPSAAGFGAAEPAPPTTADETTTDESPERSNATEHQDADAANEAGLAEVSIEKGTSIGQDARVEPDAAGAADTAAPDASERVSPDELPSPEASSGTAGRAQPEEPSSPEEQARPEALTPQAEPALPAESTTQESGSQEGVSREADEAEWETQWSEASAPTQPAASHKPAGEAATLVADTPLSEEPPAQGGGFVHHPEYTEPHAPTLPGAESAAAEAVEADPEPESTGHLAADQPYGAGSASPGPDGSGLADFDVKADAGSMVYYEKGHPDYEQTKADVWFESAAHAEAAGFRAPRRTRT
jgi:hypothetical protein